MKVPFFRAGVLGILFGTAVCMAAHAEEVRLAPSGANSVVPQNTSGDRAGGGASDLLHMTKIPDSIRGRTGADRPILLNCEDSSGQVLDRNDAGYSDCMKHAQGAGKSPTDRKSAIPEGSFLIQPPR